MKQDSTPDAFGPSRQPAEPNEQEPIFLDSSFVLLIDESAELHAEPPREHASLVPMAIDLYADEACEQLPAPPLRPYPRAAVALAVSLVACIALVLAAPLLMSRSAASSSARPTTIVLDEMVIVVEPPQAPELNTALVLSEVTVIGDVRRAGHR